MYFELWLNNISKVIRQEITYKSDKYEPSHEKNNNLGFRPGLTQTNQYSHRSMPEALNYGLKKKRDSTTCICVAKTKVLISCAVTAQLICAFVFA